MSLTYACCGRPRAQIDIPQGDCVLSFTICGECRRSSWVRDGQPTELPAAMQVELLAKQKIEAFA